MKNNYLLDCLSCRYLYLDKVKCIFKACLTSWQLAEFELTNRIAIALPRNQSSIWVPKRIVIESCWNECVYVTLHQGVKHPVTSWTRHYLALTSISLSSQMTTNKSLSYVHSPCPCSHWVVLRAFCCFCPSSSVKKKRISDNNTCNIIRIENIRTQLTEHNYLAANIIWN